MRFRVPNALPHRALGPINARRGNTHLWVGEAGLSWSRVKPVKAKKRKESLLSFTVTGSCFTQYHLWERKSEVKGRN